MTTEAESRPVAQEASARTPVFDKEDQYRRIQPYVLAGEQLYAVYDCKGGGTGFVGITDKRVIFYDQGILSNRKQMVSIPYDRVIGIASVDEGVVFTVRSL